MPGATAGVCAGVGVWSAPWLHTRTCPTSKSVFDVLMEICTGVGAGRGAACEAGAGRVWAPPPRLGPRPMPSTSSSPVDLMPVRDAAELAGRSSSTVRDWIRAGHLSKHREEPGNELSRVLVSRAELVARLEELDGPRPAPPTTNESRGEAPATAPDAGLVAELASARAMVASLEERLRLVGELRESERARLEAVAESERVALASAREAFEKAREALEGAAAAHLGAADAERRRADAAEAALRDARTDLEAVRGELAGARAELEALRVRSGMPWWRRLIAAG